MWVRMWCASRVTAARHAFGSACRMITYLLFELLEGLSKAIRVGYLHILFLVLVRSCTIPSPGNKFFFCCFLILRFGRSLPCTYWSRARGHSLVF